MSGNTTTLLIAIRTCTHTNRHRAVIMFEDETDFFRGPWREEECDAMQDATLAQHTILQYVAERRAMEKRNGSSRLPN